MKKTFFSLLIMVAAAIEAATVIPTDAMFSEQTVRSVRKLGGFAAVPEKGKLQLRAAGKILGFSPFQRRPVVPLALIRYDFEAHGAGKFGFVIYFYDRAGKKIGHKSVLPVPKNGKIAAKGVFRIGETYKDQIPAFMEITGFCDGKADLTVSGFSFEYQEKAEKNTALTPVKRLDWSTKYCDGLTARAARLKAVPVLFLGDSITIGWISPSSAKYPGGLDSWNQYFKPMNAVNFGIAADTISNLLWRVTEGKQLACSPKIIVLLIGTNNLHHQTVINSASETAEGIIHLVRTIRKQLPETKIILLGVFPRKRDPNFSDFPIPAINATLAKHQWDANVIYRDYSALLLGKEGKVSPKIFRDGVHLSPAAYKLLAAELAGEITKLQKSASPKPSGK